MAPMAKKSKSTKKHRFKHAQPAAEAAAATPAASATTTPARSAAPAATVVSSAPAQATRFVAVDLRRVGLMLVGLVGLELVLWYLMSHTSLGNSIYDLIRV
jgi:hypothetical protein